jgi:UDP-N-acetylmuramate-alanine ligase
MTAVGTDRMRRINTIHFVGIGGSGMGGIAEVLINLGYKVQGSDLKPNNVTEHLSKLGAKVAFGHAANNVAGADVVVVSSAVAQDNPEVVAAREQRIPVVPRAEMLGELMRFRYSIAVGLELNIEVAAIRRALLAFQGIDRRMQHIADVDTPNGRVTIVDDYGHHPTEVAATLQALRQGYAGRRLVLAFQPHRYTRTRDLIDDFGKALTAADVLFVTEVYAAGEAPIAGADGRAICRAVRSRGQVEPVFVEKVEDLADALSGVIRDGDLIVTMGAGHISAASHALPAQLARRRSQ